MPKESCDPTLLLKVAEIILCIIGVILLELTNIFFDKWVLGWLYIGLGGYLIISVVLLITSMIDDVPHYCEVMFLVMGWLINLIAGSITIARYGLRNSKTNWVSITPSTSNRGVELGLGITSLILSIVFLADLITVFASGNEDDDYE
ncbi:uncharacterized protein [Leptinotarsa decemlineata]|uniref:uncharacterized protein n=1 Tax=Leptinotarsa decemlineata TaxID=7539 RepID=UPI003D306C2B